MKLSEGKWALMKRPHATDEAVASAALLPGDAGFTAALQWGMFEWFHRQLFIVFTSKGNNNNVMPMIAKWLHSMKADPDWKNATFAAANDAKTRK